jgi:acetate kinase
MNTQQQSILTVNGGSSTIKFGLYRNDNTLARSLHGAIERIGLKDATLTFVDGKGQPKQIKAVATDHLSATNFLIDWLETQAEFPTVKAIGHRVVHGMQRTEPELITTELLQELHRIKSFDPEHLPNELELIEAFRKRHPNLCQVACFDTAFHRAMPRVAKMLPIPRRFDTAGIQRYGFHGLSYAYLMEELARITGVKAAKGRIILAHLGNGASLAAVRDGRSLETSMGFTPASGIMMGTRPGDLDPGVAWYMMQSAQMTPEQFNHLINHDSGLIGVSETGSDMRDLLNQEAADIRSAEAVALFCYQAMKWIGAFTAVLGGLDTLVFAGGIGENCPAIRARICQGLGFLGIDLDESRNLSNAPVISRENGKTVVRVIPTDEAWMIAQTVSRVIYHTTETNPDHDNERNV